MLKTTLGRVLNTYCHTHACEQGYPHDQHIICVGHKHVNKGLPAWPDLARTWI